MRTSFCAIAISVVALGAAWGATAPTSRSVATSSASSPATTTQALLRHVKSMAYVLQCDRLDGNRASAVRKLRDCERDLIVIDPSFSGAADGRWLKNEVDAIRAGRTSRLVLAYISIGEAEDYRPYWQKGWDANRDGKPDASAPTFLCEVNPDWAGNYKVRYWDAAWQKLILAEVDNILAAGFDGLYLDIVDGFEYFEAAGGQYQDNRLNPATGQTYRQDMIDWVLQLATRARRTAGRPLAIVPQNGSQLLADASFLAAIDAIGIEDLFTNGNRRQKPAHFTSILKDLAAIQQADKPVLLIEYPTSQPLRELVRKQAAEHKLVVLLASRQLTTLGDL
jgi:cysteinyl-tRNA synthetase